jgi:release factor glutamine methyltransferase
MNEVKRRIVRRVIFPGVLDPPSDCFLLADVMRRQGLAEGARVLDLFTGSGALAIAAAEAGAREVTAVDLAWRAVMNARTNSALNRAGVRVLRGDMFGPLAGERFDLVLANPPYLPGPSDELPAGGAELAWEGGTDGRLVVDRLCREVGEHLAPGGSLLMVHSSLTGEEASLAMLREAGLAADVAVRETGALGPLMSARAELLEERGLLAPGERVEEILVFRARADRR